MANAVANKMGTAAMASMTMLTTIQLRKRVPAKTDHCLCTKQQASCVMPMLILNHVDCIQSDCTQNVTWQDRP